MAYPPHSHHKEVFNIDVFKKLCFYADNIWLNTMGQLNNTTVVKSDYNSDLLPILHFNNVNLYSINLTIQENDKQLQAVRDYYIEKFGIDAFGKLFV